MNLKDFISAWNNDAKTSLKSMQEYWDLRAESFNEYTLNRNATETAELIAYLKDKGAITKENTVIDIGCGAGKHSMAFSPYVKSIAGCDISPKMITYCEENAKGKHLNNVSFFSAAWEDVDIADLKEKFDLAFSSMSPAISSPESLDKLIACSAKHCFISGFALRTDSVLEHLYAKFGLLNRRKEHNTYYIVNILWMMGLFPDVTFKRNFFTEEISLDEAVRRYTMSMKKYIVNDAELERKVKTYLMETALDGKVSVILKSIKAWIYWQK